MTNFFLKWLEKRGRLSALVDFYGDVQMYRYCVLWTEGHTPRGWRSRFPNMFIHVYPGEPGGRGPDDDSPHAHPYNSLGVIVKGGYTEVIDEKERRTTRAFGMTYVNHKSFHRLDSVMPGTVSLFFHGWRKREQWLIDRKKCRALCNECKSTGKQACVKQSGVEPFRLDLDSNAVDRGVTTWVPVDAGFDAMIAKRKKLVRRLGVVPKTNLEKVALLRAAAAARSK